MLGTAVVRPNRSSAGQRLIALAGDRSSRSDPPRFSSKTSSKTWLASRPLRCSWCPPAEIAVNVSASPLRLACDNLRDRAGGDGTSALDGPLNVDLDVALSVLAGAVCASLRRRPPAITTPRPTPCNDGSCPPAASSSTTATPSPSGSTDVPTPQCYTTPTSPTPPSPGGADGDSTSSSTDKVGVELTAR